MDCNLCYFLFSNPNRKEAIIVQSFKGIYLVYAQSLIHLPFFVQIVNKNYFPTVRLIIQKNLLYLESR